MPQQDMLEIPIFPLNTVLFPGGLLPLKIFEQRYLDMTKRCIRDGTPFGVCLIRDGKEVGAAASPHAIGCLATIVSWDMPQLGMFFLVTEGGRKFRIVSDRVEPNHLRMADVALLDVESEPALAAEQEGYGEILKALVERIGASSFPSPLRFDDASWVGYRLAEVLPIDNAVRQHLLEMNDAKERLQLVTHFLGQKGAVV